MLSSKAHKEVITHRKIKTSESWLEANVKKTFPQDGGRCDSSPCMLPEGINNKLKITYFISTALPSKFRHAAGA